jgi:hypothetical protein
LIFFANKYNLFVQPIKQQQQQKQQTKATAMRTQSKMNENGGG